MTALADLAAQMGLPADALAETFAAFEGAKSGRANDPFDRKLDKTRSLQPPFCAVRVRAALFHTQGGLAVDDRARVLRGDGGAFANLQAAGGAACGVSGASDAGYLSGNGLLAAVVLGRIAGGTRTI